MPRPLQATIHVDAMQHNLAQVTARCPGEKIWAVVKADAYGHGLLRAMRGFAAADGLALIEIENAVRLRAEGWQKRLLLLEGFFDFSDLALISHHRLDTVVHSDEQLTMLESVGRSTEVTAPLDVYLKLNSGMNRLGFAPNRFRDAYRRLRALPVVRQIVLMTHFANADDAQNSVLSVSTQIQCLKDAGAGLIGPSSIANSAFEIQFPDLAKGWLRPGVMLYGGSALASPAANAGLKPGMTLSSKLISIQDIKKGDAVGYGSRFVAPHAMRIGIAAGGYADGYPRHAPDGTPVLVSGIRTRMVGRVSMDMITVDLTPVPDAHIGSDVILWGRGLPIDEVANAAGTVGYELMCALAARVRVVEEELFS
jgi:alanine racemase